MALKDVGIESKKQCEARTGTHWTDEQYDQYADEMRQAMRPGSD